MKYILWHADTNGPIFTRIEGDSPEDALKKAGFEDIAPIQDFPGVWTNFNEALYEDPAGIEKLKSDIFQDILMTLDDNAPGGCQIVLADLP